MKMDWLYHATCERVVDGDSIILTIDAGFDVLLKSQSVRLYGIDTAETRGGTPELKAWPRQRLCDTDGARGFCFY